ncbi:hypothetical protein OKA04_15045 [Luteolibacter flavescens]|uniref:Uncharacterized protein n=1 Tax=Luteolibacter flavescens TaxID=1859460 RepID=A0ABT3FR51_9BACT|nr:hypothetical protein [Luteolibacter flavescens]MCW1886053.1 hypothetical protein [Luteolibacter flavescens]
MNHSPRSHPLHEPTGNSFTDPSASDDLAIPAMKAVKQYVRQNPFVTLGLACGIGVIVASGFCSESGS